MPQPRIQRVAVIGAGLSGVVAAAHLLRAGLEVVVFERNAEAGGIWIHCAETAIEPLYPCMKPADAEELGPYEERTEGERRRLIHAPPGPCYDSLRNNIDTPLMQVSLRAWPKDTPRVVGHSTVLRYIREMAAAEGVDDVAVYGAVVSLVRKRGAEWHVHWARLDEAEQISTFDAVVVASGHYHAPRIPDISGLAAAKARFPDRITHSKYFRNAAPYRDKIVLLIGGGVSSTDIAKDISSSARAIYQSTRNSRSDMSASMLPDNATRVSEVAAVDAVSSDTNDAFFAVHLKSGASIPRVDRIVVCTGYQYTLPFLHHLSSPSTILITDGTQVHNLHRDIFYMPDPTLAFVGLPVHTTVFTLFEFQAVAVAAAFSGIATLPPPPTCSSETDAPRQGRVPHSFKEEGEEEAYVAGLMAWVNAGRAERGLPPLEGHTSVWRREMGLIREIVARRRREKLETRPDIDLEEKRGGDFLTVGAGTLQAI